MTQYSWELQEDERERRARAAEEGEYLEEEDAFQRLMRDAPTPEELQGGLFLEDPNAVAAPVSQAGQAQASAQDQARTSQALDLLAGQVARDQAGEVGPGLAAQGQLAELQHSGRSRQVMEGADTGSGQGVADAMNAMSGANDALLYNYSSMYNGAQADALSSLSQLGGEAGALRGQTFGEAFRRGSAVDAFNEHNLNYMRDVNMRNTERQTEHSERGAQARQQAEDNYYAVDEGQEPVRETQAAIDQAEADRQAELAGLPARLVGSAIGRIGGSFLGGG